MTQENFVTIRVPKWLFLVLSIYFGLYFLLSIASNDLLFAFFKGFNCG